MKTYLEAIKTKIGKAIIRDRLREKSKLVRNNKVSDNQQELNRVLRKMEATNTDANLAIMGKYSPIYMDLNLHQSRSCVMSAEYKPKAFYSISDAELNKIFHVPSDSVPDNSNIIIEQTVFETEDEIGFDDMNDVKGLQEANEPISTQTTASIRQPIDSLSTLQSKFGRHLFGETFMECRSYQEFIQCVQSHYSIKQFSRKLNGHRIYNFSLECGLSRKHGVKLLSLIRSFNPSTPVPKQYMGLKYRIKMDIEKYNDLVELNFPGFLNGK